MELARARARLGTRRAQGALGWATTVQEAEKDAVRPEELGATERGERREGAGRERRTVSREKGICLRVVEVIGCPSKDKSEAKVLEKGATKF